MSASLSNNIIVDVMQPITRLFHIRIGKNRVVPKVFLCDGLHRIIIYVGDCFPEFWNIR